MAREKRKTAIDREAVEREYRLGQMSIRELAIKFDVSHQTIYNWAEKYCWVRDHSCDVKARTKAMLVKPADVPISAMNDPVTPDDIQRAVATNVSIMREYRSGVGKLRTIGNKLIDALAGLINGEMDGIFVDVINRKTGEKIGEKIKLDLIGERETPMDALAKAVNVFSRLLPLELQALGLDGGDDTEAAKRTIDDDPVVRELFDAVIGRQAVEEDKS